MSKMPAADWQQWTIGRHVWMREDVEVMVRKFME
jgi:hypothetical protein